MLSLYPSSNLCVADGSAISLCDRTSAGIPSFPKSSLRADRRRLDFVESAEVETLTGDVQISFSLRSCAGDRTGQVTLDES